MNFKPAKSMSASDLMQRLRSDDEWMRLNSERDLKHRAKTVKLQSELAPEVEPLLADLAALGISVASVSELINATWSYAPAIPTLCAHLQKARHAVLREMLARALTVREARGVAGNVVLTELQRTKYTEHSVRWALANALTLIADPSMANELEGLIENHEYADVAERLRVARKNIS